MELVFEPIDETTFTCKYNDISIAIIDTRSADTRNWNVEYYDPPFTREEIILQMRQFLKKKKNTILPFIRRIDTFDSAWFHDKYRKRFPYYVTMRGDGNCFFWSAMYCAIKQRTGIPDWPEWNTLVNKNTGQDTDAYARQFVNSEQYAILMIELRQRVGVYVYQNARKYKGFYTNDYDLAEYCEKVIQTPGVWAEGLSLTATCDFLNLNVVIIAYDPKSGIAFETKEIRKYNVNMPTHYLKFGGSHYDVLLSSVWDETLVMPDEVAGHTDGYNDKVVWENWEKKEISPTKRSRVEERRRIINLDLTKSKINL